MRPNWLFPDWENANEVIMDLANNMGGYTALVSKDKTQPKFVAVELIDFREVGKLVPEHCRERFDKQYMWFKNCIIREPQIDQINRLAKEIKPFYINADLVLRDIAGYVGDLLPECTALFFTLVMGIPMEVYIFSEEDWSEEEEWDDLT